MSFCLRPNVCKKCGKPLTLFEGWICFECEKAEQEPRVNDVLDKIRAEIANLDDAEYEFEGYYKAVNDALQIIDKYR